MLIKMLQLEDTRPGVYCSFVYGSVLVHLSEWDKYVSHPSDKYVEITITYLPSFTVLAQKSYSQGKTQNFHGKSSSYDIEGLLWVLKIVWLWTPLHKIIDLFLKKLPRFLKIEVILCKKRDSFHSFCILSMAHAWIYCQGESGPLESLYIFYGISRTLNTRRYNWI